MTIPREVRKVLDLKPSEKVIIVVEGDQVLIPLNSASCSAPKQPLVPIETGHILSE
jgi:bifunctional DNA-binding transcriptional regulator/antitoxin component of YhaV-PrlF toxin-antitoxin module